MADSLVHRGPDASGAWIDAEAGIGLAHRRLSILDLSPNGSQPMVSDSGRFVLCYNGEVYNYRELRAELEKTRETRWRGHSDTEVLLAAIERWGVQTALERSNGMFAFAVWDRHQRKLTLARDRMGEKPLYVGWVGRNLVFASELKAFRRMPQWSQSIDRQALALLLRFGYIPAPLSIHMGVFKLPAASFITLNPEHAQKPIPLNDFMGLTRRYWSLYKVAVDGIDYPHHGDEAETLEELEGMIKDAVRLRMEADVPVGAMLSGGIDSSLVSALMQRISVKPIRTFTIGFREDRFDEAKHARRIAEHIGSEHTELYLLPEQALEVIPLLPDVYDEPFADSSQIPTILVSATARQHVTVALSGDGGDELFYGYARYLNACRLWKCIGWWPGCVRAALASLLNTVGVRAGGFGVGRLGFRMRRLAHRIDARSFDDFYAQLLSLSPTPTAAENWSEGFPGEPLLPSIPKQLDGFERRMMFVDQSLYLPEDILSKVDRASMAVSLELRAPLLDHRVVEFSWRLPGDLRFDGQAGKLWLRKLLYRHVPRELVERPKQGFDIPLHDWLRGPLRTWMQDLLTPASLQKEGYLDAKAVTTLVEEHLSGCADHGYALWPTLMFQAWLRHYG